MGFFSIFRKNKTEELELVLNELPEDINYQEPDETTITIDSPDIVSISSNGVIDTTDSINIAKYRHNVALLREKVKKEKEIGPLLTIREDDFLPDDLVWRVNSKDTLYEKRGIHLTSGLKEALAEEKVLGNKRNDFNGLRIPNTPEQQLKINEEVRKFDIEYLQVLTPTYFRTTKHFTVNTPLGYTGDYNFVKADRKFTVIDDANLLLESGYAYSFSGRDAYLDVTHEGLPISDKGIILISEDFFHSIKDNKELMERLNSRRLIVYKGNLDDAINMVMSENGSLPFKAGLNIEFDNEVNDIVVENMQKICESHDLEYERSHAGSDGHFSSWLDDRANMMGSVYDEFIAFLSQKFNRQFNSLIITDMFTARNLIEELGVHPLVDAIIEYNSLIETKAKERLEAYKADRDSITPEVSDLFKRTVRSVNAALKSGENTDLELFNLVSEFYLSRTVDAQVASATRLEEYLRSMTEAR